MIRAPHVTPGITPSPVDMVRASAKAARRVHPSLMPWGPGKPVRVTGGLRRVMLIEEMNGRSVLCSWMASGSMHRDWFCLTGLVAA